MTGTLKADNLIAAKEREAVITLGGNDGKGAPSQVHFLRPSGHAPGRRHLCSRVLSRVRLLPLPAGGKGAQGWDWLLGRARQGQD